MDTRELTGIDRLAGIVTTSELLAAGVTRTRIGTLVRIGELVSLGHGTYAMAGLAKEVRNIQTGPEVLRAVAALATTRAGAVASHQTAALIHGLDLIGGSPPLVAITRTPGPGSRSGKKGVLVHSAALPAAHVTQRLGLPVTTVARTVVDLARSSDFRDGVVVADSALRSGQTSDPALRAVLGACARWPGIHRAKEVVAFADRLSESALESIARVAFRDCGLPTPELQVQIPCRGGIYRVDFFWRQFRTVAEVDGAMKYDDRSRAMYQLRRDASLREAGFEVVHFNWEEITTAAVRVSRSIRAAFERGARR